MVKYLPLSAPFRLGMNAEPPPLIRAYVVGEIVASFVDIADEAVSISTVGAVVA